MRASPALSLAVALRRGGYACNLGSAMEMILMVMAVISQLKRYKSRTAGLAPHWLQNLRNLATSLDSKA